MAYLVFDLIILILLAAFAIRGAARGLVFSLCSLLAVAVAFVGAGIAARTLSPMVAQALEPKIAAAIEEQLEESLRTQVQQGQQALAQSAAYQILFAVSFVLLMALWQVVSRVLDLVSKLPVLDTLNKSMGALFGLLQAGVIVCILAWLLRFGNLVDQETVQKTVLLRFFMDFNPLALLGALS